MARRDTRERVVEAAIRLFNERGTAAVSTNHVAEGAGISPGNLYYHFRNKEAIIRAIFGRMDAYWEGSYALGNGADPSVEELRAMVEDTFSGLWEYRFFYRELGALTRRDPELAARHRKLRERGIADTEVLLLAFLEAGVLAGPEDPVALSRLAKTLMLVAEFWMPFEETGSEALEHEPLREGVELMMQVLEPYLAVGEPAGVAGLEAGIEEHARKGGGR
ncbi:TetR/AcrR family transcriptional regulator [soil metagenome]